MNSQVCLNNKELQSVAVLHPSVLGSDIKRFNAATLSQMKKAGFSLLHNIWAKFPEIKALMQWRDSEDSVLLWHNIRSLITLEIMMHTANWAPVGLLNDMIFIVFDLLALHGCSSVILWVWWSELLHHMVSCCSFPYWNTGSAGVWCLTCLTCLALKRIVSSSIMH